MSGHEHTDDCVSTDQYDRVQEQLNEALARLGAVAALADEWRKNARDIRDATGDYADGVELEWAANELTAVLPDSAGAIAKHEQEVRAYRLGVRDAQQVVAGEDTIEWARDARSSNAALSWLIEELDDLVGDTDDMLERLARADALTEGQADV